MDYADMVTTAAAGLVADYADVLTAVVVIALAVVALFIAAELALRAFQHIVSAAEGVHYAGGGRWRIGE